MDCPRRNWCSECGDLLIHQHNRGPRESSTRLGQWVKDHIPNVTTFADHDAAVGVFPEGLDQIHFDHGCAIYREFEHKEPGTTIGNGQLNLLRFRTRIVEAAVQAGVVHPMSGMFTVENDERWDLFRLARLTVDPRGRLMFGRQGALSREDLIAWLVQSGPVPTGGTAND